MQKAAVLVNSYLKNTYLFKLQTKVLSKDGDLFQFTDTIYHPQGGGQPNDKGWLLYKRGQQLKKTDILSASMDRISGKIYYKLDPNNDLVVDEEVTMEIDPQTRTKYARLHSGGHLIDLALQRLKINWQPGKGYHFPDGPYNQYKGTYDAPEKIIEQLNRELENILKEEIQAKKEALDYEEAVNRKLIPETFKTPVVTVVQFGTNLETCGGTHIDNTNQINELKVTKLKKKGTNIKLYYIAN